MIRKAVIICTVLCMTNMMAFTQAKTIDKGQRGQSCAKSSDYVSATRLS